MPSGRIRETTTITIDPDLLRSLRWPEDRARLRCIQEEMRARVVIAPLRGTPATVAGVDASFAAGSVIAAACLMSFPALEPIEDRVAARKTSFPYIPGYLSFREGPAMLDAIEGLSQRPGLLIFDGQGIAHPMGAGIAAFMGALLDLPSVGCAKSRLVGEYKEPGDKRGDWTPVVYRGAAVGAALRTRAGTRPVFVSPGHRVDIEGAVRMVLECAPRFRLTEPVRRADALSRRAKKGSC